jgi:hypothetical protein
LAVIEKRDSRWAAASQPEHVDPHTFGTPYEFWRLLAKLKAPSPEPTFVWNGPSSKTLLAAQLQFATTSKPQADRSVNSMDTFLPWRVRYQRACVLLELECYEEAVDELSMVLDYASSFSASSLLVVDWVKKDPALRPLFRQRRTLSLTAPSQRRKEHAEKAQLGQLRQQQDRLRLILERSEERLGALPRELILQEEIVNDPRG